MSEGDLAIVLS